MGTPDILEHCVKLHTSCNQQVHFRGSSEALAVTDSNQLDLVSDFPDRETSYLYPLDPISAIQYFDDGIDGFGSWMILLATKCEGDLRKSRRADSNRFAIIKKKLKYSFYPCNILTLC